jgi:hypothetical protein
MFIKTLNRVRCVVNNIITTLSGGFLDSFYDSGDNIIPTTLAAGDDLRDVRTVAINDLPIELFRLIRDFLLTLPNESERQMNLEPAVFEKFRKIESYWSWRNFLSVSNDWMSLRKQLMIWSLNKYKSYDYTINEPLRLWILSRMYDPARQLHCTLSRGDHYHWMHYATYSPSAIPIGILQLEDFRAREFPSPPWFLSHQ